MRSWYKEETNLVTSVRQSLLVLTPRDALDVEQIGNGGHIGGDLVEIVVVHTKVVTSSRGNVVGLRRVGGGKVVGQEDTLLGELSKVGIIGNGFVVLFFTS